LSPIMEPDLSNTMDRFTGARSEAARGLRAFSVTLAMTFCDFPAERTDLSVSMEQVTLESPANASAAVENAQHAKNNPIATPAIVILTARIAFVVEFPMTNLLIPDFVMSDLVLGLRTTRLVSRREGHDSRMLGLRS
jgi:hypothetical protein